MTKPEVRTVYLEQAWCWMCPHCGLRNYCEAVVQPVVSEEELKAHAVECGAIDEWQEVPDSFGCEMVSGPEVVYCQRCEERWDTVLPGASVDDEEDFA